MIEVKQRRGFTITLAHLLLLTVCGFSLSGCATLSRLSPEKMIADPASVNAVQNMPETWATDKVIDGDILDDWSSLISDEALLSYMEEALQANPTLQAAAKDVTRARAIYNQSRAGLFPRLSAGMSPSVATETSPFDPNSSFSANLQASWEVDLWGRIDETLKASDYDLIGAEAFYRSVRQALLAEVARAYLNMIDTERQIELSRSTLDAQLETLRIVQLRYDLGSSPKRDLILAEADVAAARDDQVVTEAGGRTAIRAFQLLLGRYPDSNWTIPSQFPDIRQDIPTGQPADILRRRPDIVVAEMRLRQSFANANAVRASVWPTLDVSGGLSAFDGNAIDALNPSDWIFSIGLQFADTIFDGGLSAAQIAAAGAAAEASVFEYGQSVLVGFSDVEDQLDVLDVIDQRIVLTQQAADAARETLRLAEIQYKEGDIDLLDVQTFRQRSFEADRTLLTIERLTHEARIALYLSLGGALN